MEDQSNLLEIDRYLARTHAFIPVEPELYLKTTEDRLWFCVHD